MRNITMLEFQGLEDQVVHTVFTQHCQVISPQDSNTAEHCYQNMINCPSTSSQWYHQLTQNFHYSLLPAPRNTSHLRSSNFSLVQNIEKAHQTPVHQSSHQKSKLSKSSFI